MKFAVTSLLVFTLATLTTRELRAQNAGGALEATANLVQEQYRGVLQDCNDVIFKLQDQAKSLKANGKDSTATKLGAIINDISESRSSMSDDYREVILTLARNGLERHLDAVSKQPGCNVSPASATFSLDLISGKSGHLERNPGDSTQQLLFYSTRFSDSRASTLKKCLAGAKVAQGLAKFPDLDPTKITHGKAQ